jgi:hypothetical protein
MASLPLHVPEPYQLHNRIVDVEGFVHLQRVRYSAPLELLGKRVEVREGKRHVELFDGPRLLHRHAKVDGPADARITAPEHRAQRRPRPSQATPSPDELALIAAGPTLAAYVQHVKARHASKTLVVRRLARMLREYPREAFIAATTTAAEYGLYDLDRVERLVLKNIARDYFPTLLPELSARLDDDNTDED